MKIGAKHAFVILFCFLFSVCVFFICYKPKKKSCSEVHEDFIACMSQKTVENNLRGKKECDTKAYSDIIDFCRQAVIDYEYE